MKPLYIEGIGMISARGRGMEKFEAALKEGWIAPAISAEGRPAYRIAASDLSDAQVLKNAKRADRFSKLAVLAAYDAVKDSGKTPEQIQESTGAIVTTALGAHSTIFKFLYGIIDYGETGVSPTTFAHSIHNAAASYLTSVLGCKGPAMTVTDFYFPFQQALQLAYAWLNEGRVKHVLLGIVDECSPAMEYIFDEKFSVAENGKMNPLGFAENPSTVPGEGSVFFLLTLDPSLKKYGAFAEIETRKGFAGWTDCGLTVIAANGMGGSEKIYEPFAAEGKPVEAYADVYGGMMASGAFECAAAALMLKNGVRYTATVPQVRKDNAEPLDAVQCIAHHRNELVFVKLVK